MGKIVNLNKFRKRKRKAEDAKRAEANRRLHGRTTAERERERLEQHKLKSVLDGARLDAGDDPEGD